MSDEIILKVAEIKDYDRILEFIRRVYYPEEPITIGIEPIKQCEEDEEFSMSSLHLGTTIIALDTTIENTDNNIVGVVISGPIEPNDAEYMIEQSKVAKCKKWSEILKFLGFVESKANVCKQFNVPKCLHMHVLGVDSSMRGKSLGMKLMAKCMENGKEKGYKIASADCTSVFSIKIAQKLEMECISELFYTDYKDEEGKQVFFPPAPHTILKTFIKHL